MAGNDFKKYFDEHFLSCQLTQAGQTARMEQNWAVLVKIFFKVISHLIYVVWLDLDVKLAPDTGTPSVKAHWGTVILAKERPI